VNRKGTEARRGLFIAILVPMLICTCLGESFGYLTCDNPSYGGFWQGAWHGFISFITLPLSVWFPQHIHVYNVNNNAFLYNIGFFFPLICELEIIIPLLIFAWVIRIIFVIVGFIIAVVLRVMETLCN